MLGEELTRWTIRLALACYVAYLAGLLVAVTQRNTLSYWPSIARWLWTVGCGLFVIHVACAFHVYHDWSHAAAFEKTAVEAEQLLGVRFGGGIYFSYMFLVLWVFDVLATWTWRQPAGDSRRPMVGALQWALHAYLFFIAFNGAIVFEAGPTRWAGVVACLLLVGLALRAAYNTQCGVRIAVCEMPDKETTSDLGNLNPEP